MRRMVQVVGYTWMALGLTGAAVGLWLTVVGLTPHPGCSDCYMASIVAIFGAALLLAGWALPLGLMCRGALGGSRGSMARLAGYLVFVVLGLGWHAREAIPAAQRAIEDLRIHGPYWGGYPERPIDAAITVVLMLVAVTSIGALVAGLVQDHAEE